MAEFKCRTGECIECCTYKDMAIPVTLPDLYRACVCAKATGRQLTISQAYEELCSGWMYFPRTYDRNRVIQILTCPSSKIPCPNVDMEKKVCKVHNTSQYAACRHYPEGMLIEASPGFEDKPESASFWKSLECMHGVSLTPEREKELKALCDLTSREIDITGQLLNSEVQPLVGKSLGECEAELKRRLSFFDEPEYLSLLVKYMHMDEIQERYMELFDIDSPDYTISLVPDAPKVIVRPGKIGRNDRCPCGSNLKFKKCCGGH